jgi:murein DD-endopeptidase MepM/ murein hydrolase activator NlpD
MRPAHSAIASLVAVALVGTAAPPALAQPALSYFAPGNILPNAGLGVQGRKVWFPDWTFPMRVGAATGQHAYIGTQLTQYHGVDWVNDPRLFAYPHRDNQCEPRSWTMQPCPAGKGHQGVDIRANDNRNNFWPVVAVEAGVVTSVTASTTVQVRSGNHTVRYLHMDRASIAAAGIAPGVNVARGQELGKVSCILSGSCQTSRHLHFDAYTGAAGAGSFYHVYPSLMAAYRRAWGLSDGIANGELALDANHEVGVGPTPEPQEPSGSCDNVALAAPLAGVDLNRFSSLWRHNCSIVGLVANASSSGRSFVYYRPKSTLGDLILSDLTLFEGANVGGRFTGIAKHYSRLCGVQRFSVEGEAFEENGVPAVRVTGSRQRLDENCQSTGANTEVLRFNFVERVIPSAAGSEHVIPEPRATLSELTRNFLAITFYPGADGQTRLLPYFSDFPGYSNEGGRIDSGGGLIPALSTDEGGVAISWVWMRKMALFTQGVLVTPR